ncbi:uncharacterized protein RCC_10471 [Ramularia collo-cygni]|uniref:CUE domain-containing protein n=1 Tax=Ramularia collo-cygni TaxID=112498 RepID=A0A2D3V9N7_9PEZI|nr:uncharacterized protein RCC_10471 [Ramularia collo-cygni]CZT24743.1 uncharacterized protein RCC_10471 [Ramularia collo-cygni]
MSNQGGYYHSPSSGEPLPSSNPWADESGLQQNQPYLQQPLQPQQGQQENTTQQWNTEPSHQAPQSSYQAPQSSYQAPQSSYQAPQSGYQAPPGLPPRRTDTFQDEAIVPAEERGEQREALEHFEMSNTKPESEADRAVAALQNEFPSIDGSLIAAIFSDSQNVGATREMLRELASS